MKNAFLLLILVFGIILISGCEKSEVKSLQLSCCPEVFSVPNWYSDSIYYTGNKISRINKYFLLSSEKNTQSRFEYAGNEVKIFVRDLFWGSWRDEVYFTFLFSDNRISSVKTNSGRVQADYYYEGTRLKYILYHRESLLSDSLSVQYYPDGNNIRYASWFKFNRQKSAYEEASTVIFTYDDKVNPYRNSVHFLYNFYDGEEFSLDYFNRNNLKTVKSKDYDLHPGYVYNYNLHSEYIYNENGYPVSIIFYNDLNQVTDRNTIAYNCN